MAEMTEDEWTSAALTDAAIVADLLVHLKKKKKKKKEVRLSPPLRWRVKRRRSRNSPSTPLAWCCGGGATPASGGAHESTSAAAAAEERSDTKGVDASENMTMKRLRKKKTLAELKEEEDLVLKERSDLKKKLASLHVTVEIERAANDNLKRLKLYCGSLSAKRVTLPAPIEEFPKAVPTNQENKFILPDLNLPTEDHTF